jgi:hypothetical protein
VRKQGKIFLIIRVECSQCDCTMTTIGGSCGWLGPKGKDHTAANRGKCNQVAEPLTKSVITAIISL